MAEGNRKDPRARVLNMTVRYKSATVDEFIENHSHDISRGGIFIKTRAPFPAGTLLKFEVRIAEDQRLMQGVGRVVWRREPERAEDGFPAGMGIKFIKTGEGAAELIAQIVAARQGEESSFDAGARETGTDVDGSDGGRSGVPAVAEASEPPHPHAPGLQPESSPASQPSEAEIRVSSPAKKRTAAASETRKVVLQGAAFDAPSSDKTPISAAARAVAAQLAGEERAPSRPAPTGKERGSIVDETTAPRRSGAARKSAQAAAQKQGSPSVYGLVAFLTVLALALLFIKLARDPEPSEPAVPMVNDGPAATPPANQPAPSPAANGEPPIGETGEGAGDPPAAPLEAQQPAAAAPVTGAAAAPSTPPVAPAANAAPAPSVTAPGVTAPSAPAPSANPPSASPAAGGAPAQPAKPGAGAAAGAGAGAAAPAPAKAAAAPAKPPPAAAPPPKPKPAVKPAPGAAGDPSVSIRPAAPEADPAAPGGSGAPTDTEPAEPAKKRPPTAAAPSDPEPAPSPKPAPSDDNPY